MKWINCSEIQSLERMPNVFMMPPCNTHVLVFDLAHGICRGYFSESGIWYYHPADSWVEDNILHNVTHWMELPEVPELNGDWKTEMKVHIQNGKNIKQALIDTEIIHERSLDELCRMQLLYNELHDMEFIDESDLQPIENRMDWLKRRLGDAIIDYILEKTNES